MRKHIAEIMGTRMLDTVRATVRDSSTERITSAIMSSTMAAATINCPTGLSVKGVFRDGGYVRKVTQQQAPTQI